MSYDSSERIKREVFVADAGGAATTAYAKNRSFAARKLEAAHFTITTAGTAAGHGFDVYIGTSSVDTVSLGIAASGTAVATINQDVDAGALVTVKSKSDATGKADVIYRFRHES